jgi:hypothetical protein
MTPLIGSRRGPVVHIFIWRQMLGPQAERSTSDIEVGASPIHCEHVTGIGLIVAEPEWLVFYANDVPREKRVASEAGPAQALRGMTSPGRLRPDEGRGAQGC